MRLKYKTRIRKCSHNTGEVFPERRRMSPIIQARINENSLLHIYQQIKNIHERLDEVKEILDSNEPVNIFHHENNHRRILEMSAINWVALCICALTLIAVVVHVRNFHL